MMEEKKLENNFKLIKISGIIGAIIVILCLIYISGVLTPLIYLSARNFGAIALGLTLVVAFIITPAKKTSVRKRIPWYDILFIAVSIISTGYLIFFEERVTQHSVLGIATIEEIVLTLLLCIAILEATRRVLGAVFSAIALIILLFVIFGTNFGLDRLTVLLYFTPQGIFGSPVTIAFTIIVAFLLFGAFLQKSSANNFMIDLSLGIGGRYTGGPAKATTLLGAALGMITGVGPAAVAICGTIAIPIMKRMGYSGDYSSAVQSVAANGATIMPPVMGIVAFLIADTLGISYWAVCIAAFVPALLYYFSIFVQIHLYSKLHNLQGLPKDQIPSVIATLKQGWYFLLPLIVLVILLGAFGLPADFSALYATLIAIIVAILDLRFRKKIQQSPKEITIWVYDCIKESGRMMIMPVLACAAAGIMLASISAAGIGFKIGYILTLISGGNLLFLLILVAIVCFIMGMGLPGIISYMVLATLAAPVMINLGVAPIAAHLYIFYWSLTSMITPPVALVVYVASAIAESDPWKSGWLACRLGFLTFVLPFIFVYSPGLLMLGTPWNIVYSIIIATIGIFILSSAFSNYLLKKLSVFERIMFSLGGILLLIPIWWLDIIAFCMLIPMFIIHKISVNRTVKAMINS